MEEAKHTPGPWVYDPDMSRTISGGAETGNDYPTICDVLDTSEGLEGDDPTADANGRLIAAAPDLLAACESFVAAFRDHPDRDEVSFALAREAVAKARGG